MWIDYDKQYLEDKAQIEREIQTMKLKDIREQAEKLQHENDWLGLQGKEMTRFSILKDEFFKRTKTHFRVSRIVYP